jgi:hypothetical protein
MRAWARMGELWTDTHTEHAPPQTTTDPSPVHNAAQIANLQRQVRALQDELEERDADIRDLGVVAEAAADLQAADQQSAKIIELSKKVRGCWEGGGRGRGRAIR